MLKQTLPVVFLVGFVALARLVGQAADSDPGFAPKDGSAIQLTEDFKLAELRAMPHRASTQWRLVRRDYPTVNAVEWQVRLRSPEREDPPLWENPCSADFVVAFPLDAAASLHWSKGSHDSPSDFQPCEDALDKGKTLTLESFGGRSSDGTLPYFNLASQGGGLILALGWTGDWRTFFEALGAGRVRVRAGLQQARFKLRPGEQVRLPSVLVIKERDGFHLLDLGNPEARRWALETVSQQIREADIGIYRQDCNLYPAFFWRTAEETNRIGLREIRHTPPGDRGEHQVNAAALGLVDQVIEQAQVIVVQQVALAVADFPVKDVQPQQVQAQPLEVRQVCADGPLMVCADGLEIGVVPVKRRIVIDPEQRDLFPGVLPAEQSPVENDFPIGHLACSKPARGDGGDNREQQAKAGSEHCLAAMHRFVVVQSGMVQGALLKPSDWTTQVASSGKPGAGLAGAPSQPAAIMATA